MKRESQAKRPRVRCAYRANATIRAPSVPTIMSVMVSVLPFCVCAPSAWSAVNSAISQVRATSECSAITRSASSPGGWGDQRTLVVRETNRSQVHTSATDPDHVAAVVSVWADTEADTEGTTEVLAEQVVVHDDRITGVRLLDGPITITRNRGATPAPDSGKAPA